MTDGLGPWTPDERRFWLEQTIWEWARERELDVDAGDVVALMSDIARQLIDPGHAELPTVVGMDMGKPESESVAATLVAMAPGIPPRRFGTVLLTAAEAEELQRVIDNPPSGAKRIVHRVPIADASFLRAPAEQRPRSVHDLVDQFQRTSGRERRQWLLDLSGEEATALEQVSLGPLGTVLPTLWAQKIVESLRSARRKEENRKRWAREGEVE